MPKFRLVLAVLPMCALLLSASAHATQPARQTEVVVMLSDLHFDPYQDPAKLGKLISSPVDLWPAILNAPNSEKQAAQFADLQRTCKARGADSSWGVIADSLKAAHARERNPLFVTVSGDLLAHGFDCRMRALRPTATPAEVSHFASKAVRFLAIELRKSFPGARVYLALGNNDSGCTDYEETPNSAFLRDAAESFSMGMPDKDAQSEIRREFSALGDYEVALPAPIKNSRLLVLQDMFQSKYYAACGGKHDAQAGADQIDWLRTRLAAARARRENVWVMAHIPPGVDVYSSFHKFVFNPDQMCSVQQPTELLGSDDFANVLAEYADVVKLALFAHTHMDEMKLVHNEKGAVPAKLVPSVSLVNGNTSAFTLARVDAASATMLDYTVYARGTSSGEWAEEYTYSKLYGMPDYSAGSVKKLTDAMAADKTGDAEISRKYEKWFYPGDTGLYGLGLRQIWPAYACANKENGGAEFHGCMCSSPAPAPKP